MLTLSGGHEARWFQVSYMKHILISTVFAGVGLIAQEASAIAAVGPITPNVQEDLQAYVEAGTQVARALSELTSVLKKIKSRDTADAASDEVRVAAEKLVEVSKAAEALPPPSPEQQARLVYALKQSGFVDTTRRFLKVFMPLAVQNCYESKPLREALKLLEETEAIY